MIRMIAVVVLLLFMYLSLKRIRSFLFNCSVAVRPRHLTSVDITDRCLVYRFFLLFLADFTVHRYGSFIE